ncbi:unnamed protein product [Chondrus crispus]|uniref:Prefoldin subunit 2 n=1 Tax=Chondrus crispus TaxID=2769 RepID=R7QPW2_CHOCR|nr:unnamed protein product [Chondrus crispus]CDF40154.1 unnamed protein product [Chondrus crispus]|eukprot:XP_005710448.1 unnamed protein product [Chondrus crispus]
MAENLTPEQQKELVGRYQGLRQEGDALYTKLGQVDGDRNEHELVLKQLSGLDGNRRCWQQIGPVLAEKKVADVLPVLTMNRDRFTDTVKQLSETIKEKDKEITEMQTKYGIREVQK